MSQNAQFHEKAFDQGTRCKLEIYRQYLRSWYPVFVGSKDLSSMVVLDYFSGPGCDANENPGSPLIALEEAEASLNTAYQKNQASVPIWLYFSDSDQENVDELEGRLAKVKTRPGVKVNLCVGEFLARLDATEHLLASHNHACLAFIDQFGVQHVTPEVFRRLVQYPKTDVLFFISSSFVKRFASEPSFQARVPVSPEAVQRVMQTDIHRFLCRKFYKPLVPNSTEYYLAPFSIRKGKNIYGLIFGSHSLLGLQKFLEVCWKMDEVSGEANYNIDGEWVLQDGEFAFEGSGTTQKQVRFEGDLWNEIEKGNATNLSLSRFILESGFLPKHAMDLLKARQRNGGLSVVDPSSGKELKKGAFYLDWKTNGRQPTKARFLVRKEKNAFQQN